jgi:colanic acid biosynthesis glycosyl transferase WcaI
MTLREEHNGVTILRSWLWVPSCVTSIKRILHEASFLVSSLLRALCTRKPDLLFVASPPLGLGLSAYLLSNIWRVPYVFDVEDLQPDSAADLNMLPHSVLPLLYRLERLAYRHATLVSTLTEGMRQRIIAKGVPADKVVIFPPRTSDNLFKVGGSAGALDFRAEHGLEGKFVVVHSGNMGVKQGLEVMLEAAAKLRDMKHIVFLLVGSGARQSSLEAHAAALQLDNLRFLPLQQEQKFMSMLAATDLALITQQRTVSDIAFPSKTVTLFSAGCPVVASVNANSEVARVVESSGAGVVTEPEDSADLADAIYVLSQRTDLLASMRGRARKYARDHWYPSRVLPLMEELLIKAAVKRTQTVVKEEYAGR